MLLTVKDVSKMLQVSEWYVYQHFKEVGGFYLPGGKTFEIPGGENL